MNLEFSIQMIENRTLKMVEELFPTFKFDSSYKKSIPVSFILSNSTKSSHRTSSFYVGVDKVSSRAS